MVTWRRRVSCRNNIEEKIRLIPHSGYCGLYIFQAHVKMAKMALSTITYNRGAFSSRLVAVVIRREGLSSGIALLSEYLSLLVRTFPFSKAPSNLGCQHVRPCGRPASRGICGLLLSMFPSSVENAAAEDRKGLTHALIGREDVLIPSPIRCNLHLPTLTRRHCTHAYPTDRRNVQ